MRGFQSSMLCLCWVVVFGICVFPAMAGEPVLDGPRVFHFPAPDNFKEKARFIRQGRLTEDGMCEFKTVLSAAPGETIQQHELAYDPLTCRSLVVQGVPLMKNRNINKVTRKEHSSSEDHKIRIKNDETSSENIIYASYFTWYEDPIKIKINGVNSQIWWGLGGECVSDKYFHYNSIFHWYELSNWIKESSSYEIENECSLASLNSIAHFSNDWFPTCRPLVEIFYDENMVIGQLDGTAIGTSTTRQVGPSFLCTDIQSQHKELTVEETGTVLVDGEIGCPEQSAALFFNDVPLREGRFSTSATGKDYDGKPIYFQVNGSSVGNLMILIVAMYSDQAQSRHIRTDQCQGIWDGDSFYDGSCDLKLDTTASCEPIWMQLTRSNPDSQVLEPRSIDLLRLDTFAK